MKTSLRSRTNGRLSNRSGSSAPIGDHIELEPGETDVFHSKAFGALTIERLQELNHKQHQLAESSLHHDGSLMALLDENQPPQVIRDTRTGERWVVSEEVAAIHAHRLDRNLPYYGGSWLALFISIPWAVVLWLGVAFTMMIDTLDGYTHYFTNWMWTFQTVYVTGYILLNFDVSTFRSLRFYWIAALWWPLLANATVVFVGTFVLVCDAQELLNDAIEESGICAVLIVDRIKHILSELFPFLLLLLTLRDHILILENICATSSRRNLALYIVYNFIASHLVIVAYATNFDFYKVYGISIPGWITVCGIEAVYVVVIIGGITLLSPPMASWRERVARAQYRLMVDAVHAAHKMENER